MDRERKGPRVKTVSCSHMLQWEKRLWLKGILRTTSKVWYSEEEERSWLIWQNEAIQTKGGQDSRPMTAGKPPPYQTVR